MAARCNLRSFSGQCVGLGIHFLLQNPCYLSLYYPENVVELMDMALKIKWKKRKKRNAFCFPMLINLKFKIYLHFSVEGSCSLIHKVAYE